MRCGKEYEAVPNLTNCSCGGILDIVYDYDYICLLYTSHVVLEQLGHEDDSAEDQLGYLTRTKDGKILKSSSVYIRDETGKVTGILGINYDISMMQLFENSLHAFISADQQASREPERITLNVEMCIRDSVCLFGCHLR